MPRDFIYFWDPSPDANEEHVADGGVTAWEFEQALERGFERRELSRGAPEGIERWEAEGYTNNGRYLVVVFELDELDDPKAWGVTPVTAYDPEAWPEKG